MIRATQAQAAHFILEKNHLTRPAGSLVQLVETLGGLPGDPQTTPFLSAKVRLQTFEPEELLAALHQDCSLISGVLMRSSPYIVSPHDFTRLYAATARQRRQDLNSEFRLWGIENSEIEQVGAAILTVLGDQPATAQTIAARLGPTVVRKLTQTSRGGRVTTTGNVELALRWLTANGILVAVPQPTEDWLYAPLSQRYPNLNLSQVPDEATAQRDLVRDYLATFGPAAEADISFWTGLSKSETARAINSLSPETTLTLVEGMPGMMLLLRSQADGLRDIRPLAAPLVNVLPANDPFTMAHRASRSRYVTDQSLQRQIFSSSGSAKPTILVNGQIVGLWQGPNDDATTCRWQLLTGVDRALQARIEAEMERMDLFLALRPWARSSFQVERPDQTSPR